MTKKCAICGSEPLLTTEDMGTGNGHGYPGYTSYTLKCPKCKMISASANNLYDTGKKVKAAERVIIYWNKKVNDIEKYLQWRVPLDTAKHPFLDLTNQELCDYWNNTFDSNAWVHKDEIIINSNYYTRVEFMERLTENLLTRVLV